MSCAFDKELVQEFAIGEITPEERAAVTTHLADCTECRAEITALRQLARDLTRLPEPEFPADLEEVLVLSSIQAGLAARPETVRAVGRPALRPAWLMVLGGTAGLAILTLLIVILWPGRLPLTGPGGHVVPGQAGQGLGLLDGVLRWVQDLQTGWSSAKEFVGRFAPVGKALRVAFGGIGSSFWAALLLGAAGATFLLWRVSRTGQKKMRSLGDAEPH
jgi:anti-sigma factor RsiW